MAIMRGRASIGLAAAALLAAVPAAAQIELGDRVRVHAAGQRSIIGTLQSLDETALVLKPDGSGDLVTVNRSRMRGVDVSQRRSRKGRGALIGLVGGVAAGAAVGSLIASDCSEVEFLCLYPREARHAYIAVSAIGFGLLGGVLGAVVAPGERWDRVPVDRVRVRVLTGPARAVGLGVSITF
jgi:hypothetical protein